MKTRKMVGNMIFDELLIQRTLGHMMSYYFVNFQPKVDYPECSGITFLPGQWTAHELGMGVGSWEIKSCLVFSEFYYKLLGMAVKKLDPILAFGTYL